MERSFAARSWSADTVAKTLGAIFIIVGILGFIPNPLVSERGFFEVNGFHNIVHLATGAILLASPWYDMPAMTLRVFGIIYAIITFLGFVSLRSLDVLSINHPDNWLHLVLALIMLWAGFAATAEDTDRVTTAHM
jgi:hypothetical protein